MKTQESFSVDSKKRLPHPQEHRSGKGALRKESTNFDQASNERQLKQVKELIGIYSNPQTTNRSGGRQPLVSSYHA